MDFIQQNYTWLLPLGIFELVMKALALWKSARNNQLYWYIAVVVLNTAGVLPLLYLLFFQQKRASKKK